MYKTLTKFSNNLQLWEIPNHRLINKDGEKLKENPEYLSGEGPEASRHMSCMMQLSNSHPIMLCGMYTMLRLI